MRRLILLLISLLISSSTVMAETPQPEAEDAAIIQAKRLPVVEEFFAAFPQATIADSGTTIQGPYARPIAPDLIWLQAGLYDRHIIEMSFRYKINDGRLQQAATPEFKFQINTVSTVNVDENTGVTHKTFDPEQCYDFSLKDWRKFIAGGCHFESIDIHLLRTSPVANFNRVWPCKPDGPF